MSARKPTNAPKPIDGIMDTPPYVAGRAQIDGLSEAYKLSANENALGASPAALRALSSGAGELSRYPDGHASALRAALAKKHGLDEAQIVCGNGSGDLLLLLAHGLLQAGDEFIYSEHGFLLYEIVGRCAGATPICVPERALVCDVDAILNAVSEKTKIIFIANPNNPTGTMIAQADMERLVERLRSDVLLVIDEAYAEYVEAADYANGFALMRGRENILVLRTFSKAYGLAALRLGWCVAPRAIADMLNRLRGAFNVSAPAQIAGLAALADEAHITASREHNRQWRDWFYQQCAKIGFALRVSHANFILLEFETEVMAEAAQAHFMKHGVIARALGAYRLAHALRLTIGDEVANRAAFAALESFVGNKGGDKGRTHE